MDIHPVDIIISLVNIVVLFFLLRLILWKHVNRYLSNRSSRIRGDIEDAARIRKESEELKASYNEKIAELIERDQEILQDGRTRGRKEAERMIGAAKSVVNQMMREAEVRIEMNKEQAVKDANAEIVQLATEMAARILRREVSAVDNSNVVDNFFNEE